MNYATEKAASQLRTYVILYSRMSFMYAPLAPSSKLFSLIHWFIHEVILGRARFLRTILCCSRFSWNILSETPLPFPIFILNIETRIISAKGSPGTGSSVPSMMGSVSFFRAESRSGEMEFRVLKNRRKLYMGI